VTSAAAASAAPATTGPTIAAPAMPARRDPLHERVLADPTLLADMAFAVGGPFHVMYPERVERSIADFHAVFDHAGVGGAVYYAKKANKAACVVRACANGGAGVDVSSVGEFAAALAGGVRGHELMVTGPAKSDELLWLAARHGALIAIDSLDELDRLGTLAGGPGDLSAAVLLRVRPPGSSSRFGLTDAELSRAVSDLDPDGPISLDGLSFHLSGYDPAPRATLAAALIDRCRAARALGHAAPTLSIGGGFGVDYLDAAPWESFTAAPDHRWFHGDQAVDDFYPYHCRSAGAAMLAEILRTAGLSNRLRENGVRLAVEPGRALLAGAGCTVMRVRGVKTRAAHEQNYDLLTVDGTSLSLSEQWFNSEYLPDPVLWPAQAPAPAPVPTAVGAATCLETDLLSRRRIPLPRPARPGDLLVYPNTAGYQMDSNESRFHELPLPPKLVLHTEQSRLRWTLDRPSS
jgi:diaminopimelate decarboxylase